MSAFRTRGKGGCSDTDKGVTDKNSDAEAAINVDKSDKHEEANHTDAEFPDTAMTTTTSVKIHVTDDELDATENEVKVKITSDEVVEEIIKDKNDKVEDQQEDPSLCSKVENEKGSNEETRKLLNINEMTIHENFVSFYRDIV